MCMENKAIRLHVWGGGEVTITTNCIRGIYKDYEGTIVELVGDDEVRVRESVLEIYDLIGGKHS